MSIKSQKKNITKVNVLWFELFPHPSDLVPETTCYLQASDEIVAVYKEKIFRQTEVHMEAKVKNLIKGWY